MDKKLSPCLPVAVAMILSGGRDWGPRTEYELSVSGLP